jgi:hypothetical protein
MSLKTAIAAVLTHGDALATAWLDLQAQAKRVSYASYETACIQAISAKYGVALNADGTLPKTDTAAYQRLKRLRRAHPEFVGGGSRQHKAEPVRTRVVARVAGDVIAALVAAGLSKAEVAGVLKAVKDGITFE